MYKVIEKTFNEAFQAERFEIEFTEKSNIICGVVSRQHNFADCFLEYFFKKPSIDIVPLVNHSTP